MQERGCRYDPPISCGAMLLRNITTALKFYLSSPLAQVDQEEKGGGEEQKQDRKPQSVCVVYLGASVCACTSYIFVNNKPTSSMYACRP